MLFPRPNDARASLQCLLAALAFFLISHVTAALTGTMKIQYRLQASWWVTLSPLWIGNGIAMLLEILSVVLAAPIVKRVILSSNPNSEDFITFAIIGRNCHFDTCCQACCVLELLPSTARGIAPNTPPLMRLVL